MVVFPEVQARARKELDQVVGRSRLPDFEDRENLPYLDAVLSETFRWNPVTPMCEFLSEASDIYRRQFLTVPSLQLFLIVW